MDELKKYIRSVPDFPKPGINFYDLTTLFADPVGFKTALDKMEAFIRSRKADKILGIESRGFILGGAIAAKLGAGFVPIRKPGKLPAETISATYKMEYGTNSIEIHKDAIKKDDILLLHDDLLATGGTVRAAVELLKSFNPRKIYICFFCELDFLKGRETLPDFHIRSLIHF